MNPKPLPAAPPTGNMRFYNNKIPALEDGRYKISVQQELAFTSGDPTTPRFAHEQQFLVHGTRFALDATALHAVYPPGGSLGDYENKLAHIVLTKPALPWERELHLSGDRKIRAAGPRSSEDRRRQAPWMALLLFEEDELLVDEDNPSPTRSTVRPIAAILAPEEDNVFRPPLALDPIEKSDADLKAITIDIKSETFSKLVPGYEELPYLAHVRQVNPEDKEFGTQTGDGWFAVLIGNRLIKADREKGTPQIAHLVSLEGFRPYLPQADGRQSKNFDNREIVRLVSLAGWRFTANPGRGDFGALMENMNCDLLRFPSAEEPCRAPHPQAAATDASAGNSVPKSSEPLDAGQLVTEAIQQGYVALNYGPTRLGEHTVAWYRGPFAPIMMKRANLPAFLNAESAMIYDERTGLFDLSYAVAWQIGRLLALSDRQFGVDLLQWQRQHHRLLDNLQSRQNLYRRYQDILNFPQNMDQMLADSLMRPLFFNFFIDRFSARVVPRRRTAPLFTSGDPSGLLQSLSKLPGVLSPAKIETILESPQDPHRRLFQTIFSGMK